MKSPGISVLGQSPPIESEPDPLICFAQQNVVVEVALCQFWPESYKCLATPTFVLLRALSYHGKKLATPAGETA